MNYTLSYFANDKKVNSEVDEGLGMRKASLETGAHCVLERCQRALILFLHTEFNLSIGHRRGQWAGETQEKNSLFGDIEC